MSDISTQLPLILGAECGPSAQIVVSCYLFQLTPDVLVCSKWCDSPLGLQETVIFGSLDVSVVSLTL